MGKPKIRFKGYEDDWEQRKVSEIGNIVTGSTPKTSISDNYGGEFLFVSPADIQENRYVDETITTLTKKGFDQGRKIREKASLFVSIGSTIGKVAQTSQESTTNQQINAVEPYDNFDDDFIFTSLENISGSIKAIASNQAVPIVNKTTFGETEIKVPSELAEQQKIGAYFRNLDHLITLHQRKCYRFIDIALDAWEQRRLGNVLLSLQNNTLSRANLSDESGIAKNVHYGDVLIKFGEVLDVRKEKLPMITDENVLSKYKASFLQNGDVIVADTAEDSTVGKCSEIAGLNDEVVLSGLHTIPYRPIEKFASGYLGYYLNSGAYHNQLIPLMQGIKVTSISKSAMQNTDIDYPKSQEEQGKIGAYFKSLDEMITLHQRKCEETKSLKKYMLQKMFPENGKCVPKIRFSGFSDDWEQRKLDGWGTFYYGRSCPKWSVTEDATIPCIRYGELYTKFGAKIDRVYSYTNMPPENLRFSKGTEVLIPRVGEDPMDYNHCTWLSMPDVAIGEMISVFNTDNNPLFTATMFNATLQNEFAMRVEGGSVTNLYFEKLKNIEVSFPSIQEQEKIAAYFENLDHLITLHQHKCDELQKLKKFMLQNMFV